MANFKSVCLFLLALILAPLASAEANIEDPSQITSLDSKVMQSGGVSISGQSIRWVKLNITAPQNREYQTSSNKADHALDEFGNSIMVSEEESPSNAVYYSLESIVQTESRRTRMLPKSYTIPDDVKKYMKPSTNIQSDDARIIQRAKEISANKNSDFEKIAALASYVHNNTEYIESFGTFSKDALWVFENKVGTCDEYSSLFIALARSIGYPARYISGHAYGDKGWTPHAWAEVYLGRWVPVDATWLEVGWLDGTHIEFHASGTNQVENTAEIYGVNAKIEKWLPGETVIEPLDYDLREKDSGYSLLQTTSVLEPGETSIVVLKIIPSEYAVLEASLVPCKSETPIVSIDNRERETVLVPGEETILWWHVTAEKNLQKNIIYTCPLVLNSRLLGVRKVNITVDTSGRDEDSVALSAELRSPVISAGDAQTVFAAVERTKGLEDYVIGFLSKDGYTEKEFSKSRASVEFSFTPKNTGINHGVLFSSTGQALDIEYDVRLQSGTRISDASVPSLVKLGDAAKLSVVIKSPDKIKRALRLKVIMDEKETVQNFELHELKTVEFIFSPVSTGEKTVRLELSGDGAYDSRIEKFRVYDIPEIQAALSEDFGKNIATIQIVALRDSAENVTVRFLGQEENIGSISGKKDVEFDITEFGVHEAEITFNDASGGIHTQTFHFDVKKEGFLQRIARTILSFLGIK